MLVTQREHAKIHHVRSWDLLEAHRLYLKGHSSTQLAKRYGIHHVTIVRGFSRTPDCPCVISLKHGNIAQTRRD